MRAPLLRRQLAALILPLVLVAVGADVALAQGGPVAYDLHQVVLTDTYLGGIPRFHHLSGYRFSLELPAGMTEAPAVEIARIPARADDPERLLHLRRKEQGQVEVAIDVSDSGYDPTYTGVRVTGRNLHRVSPPGLIGREQYAGWDRTPFGMGITYFAAVPVYADAPPLRALSVDEAVALACDILLINEPGRVADPGPLSFLSKLPVGNHLDPRDRVRLRDHLASLEAYDGGHSSTRGSRGRIYSDDSDLWFDATRLLCEDLEVLASWERRVPPLGTNTTGPVHVSHEPFFGHLESGHLNAVALLFASTKVPEIKGRAGALALRPHRAMAVWSLLDPLLQAVERGEAILPGAAEEQQRAHRQLVLWSQETSSHHAFLWVLGGGLGLIGLALGLRTLSRRTLFA